MVAQLPKLWDFAPCEGDDRPATTLPAFEATVVGVKPLPCCGEGCLDATRELFEAALRHEPGVAYG